MSSTPCRMTLYRSYTKIQVVFPKCQEHSGQRCEANCKECNKECNKPVCIKCIVSGPHKGHDIEKLTEMHEDKSRNIKSDTQEIKERRCLGSGIGKFFDKFKVIATIPTSFRPLYSVACFGEEEAWIYGDESWIFGPKNTSKRIHADRRVRATVTITCQTWPGDISLTKGGELIYSDRSNRTVNIVKRGKSKILITTPQGWIPDKLCCTSSGEVLVQVSKEIALLPKKKIIRYKKKKIKQEINEDEQGEPIFNDEECSLFMSENNNGDVCVSDTNANTVVVVDKSGRVRFRYDGTPARRKKSFDPKGIATDAVSQIIVTDSNNDCLHILDQNGQFLKCVNDCGLEKPFGLSVDSEGRIWVGSLDTGEIKILKYLK